MQSRALDLGAEVLLASPTPGVVVGGEGARLEGPLGPSSPRRLSPAPDSWVAGDPGAN